MSTVTKLGRFRLYHEPKWRNHVRTAFWHTNWFFQRTLAGSLAMLALSLLLARLVIELSVADAAAIFGVCNVTP